MSKNIVMQELTNTRYEPLYPKTSTTQINGIENYDWQIGDIRSTARTDLGDKWLLCNGSVIDTSDEYSEVGDLLGKSAGSWILENTVATNNFFTSSVSSIWAGYVNGKYVAMGIDLSNSNNVKCGNNLFKSDLLCWCCNNCRNDGSFMCNLGFNRFK